MPKLNENNTSFSIFHGLVIILLTISVLLSLNAIVQVSKWKGNPFPGFFLFNTVTVSQVSLPHWPSQDNDGPKSYDRIISVNNTKISNSQQVYEMISRYPVGTSITYLVERDDQKITLNIPTMEFKLFDLIQVFGVQFFAGVILLITGAIVYFLRPNIIESKAFILLCLSLGIWFIEDIDYQTTYSIIYSLNISYLALIFAPACWIFIALVFPNKKQIYLRNKFILVVPFILSALIFVAHLKYLNNVRIIKLIDIIILFYMLISNILFLISIIQNYLKPESKLDQQRSQVVLLGSIFGFFIPTVACIIIILYGINYVTFLTIPVLFFPISIAYAIVKYKLFDIEIIIQKTLVYTGLSGVLGFAIVIMILGFNYLFASQGGWKSPGFFVFLSVFLVVALNPVRDRIQNIIDGAFFRKRYDYERTIYNLGEAMTSILNIDEIGKKIINTITDTMQIDSSTFLLLDREQSVYKVNVTTLEKLKSSTFNLDVEDKLISTLIQKRHEIYFEDLISDNKYDDIKDELILTFNKLNSTLIMPLFFKDDLVGILSLGHKKSGLLFNSRDISLLKTLANQTAIAVENANAFRLVEDYASRLEETNKELIQTHLQLIQAEKMSAVGQLAA